MLNVILSSDQRRKLEEKGYYFLEKGDILILKNKYARTLFELVYNKQINQFILLLEDSCYYFTGLLFIELSRNQVHLQMNWYANKNDKAIKLEHGKFTKMPSWSAYVDEEE